MTVGPLEVVVVGYDGEAFTNDIAPELVRLQTHGIIRIVDLIFVAKDASGAVSSTEIEELDDASAAHYRGIASDLRKLLTTDDVANIALELLPDSAALVLLFEHCWAIDLKRAVQRANGNVLGQVRISPDVVNDLSPELEAALAG